MWSLWLTNDHKNHFGGLIIILNHQKAELWHIHFFCALRIHAQCWIGWTPSLVVICTRMMHHFLVHEIVRILAPHSLPLDIHITRFMASTSCTPMPCSILVALVHAMPTRVTTTFTDFFLSLTHQNFINSPLWWAKFQQKPLSFDWDARSQSVLDTSHLLLLCTAIVVMPSSSNIITRCMNVDIHQPVNHVKVPGTRKIDSPTHTFHTGGKTKNDQMVWFFRSQTSPHMSSRQSIPSAWTIKSPSHSIPMVGRQQHNHHNGGHASRSAHVVRW